MKLEEIRMNIEVKVIKVEGLGSPVEEYYIGKVGKIIHIMTKVPYPIKVDFGYKTGVFTPEELEEV